MKCDCGNTAIRMSVDLVHGSAYGICLHDVLPEAIGFVLAVLHKAPSVEMTKKGQELLDMIQAAPEMNVAEFLAERMRLKDEDSGSGSSRVGDDYIHTDRDGDSDTADDYDDNHEDTNYSRRANDLAAKGSTAGDEYGSIDESIR